jgi:hypothetical protein
MAYAGLLPARMGVLPIFVVFSAVPCYGGAWWMQRFPSSLNMPNQTVYDALSEEDKQKVIACTLPFFLLVRRAMDRIRDCYPALQCNGSVRRRPRACQHCGRSNGNTFHVVENAS